MTTGVTSDATDAAVQVRILVVVALALGLHCNSINPHDKTRDDTQLKLTVACLHWCGCPQRELQRAKLTPKRYFTVLLRPTLLLLATASKRAKCVAEKRHQYDRNAVPLSIAMPYLQHKHLSSFPQTSVGS